MWGSHVAVTRTPPPEDASGDTDNIFIPEQALSLESALRAYTHGSAWVNHLDDVTGTLEVGKYGDVVVLDRDPFVGEAADIGKTKVLQTFVEGERVFAR
jgi:predicted amidohydrolase YtcJ